MFLRARIIRPSLTRQIPKATSESRLKITLFIPCYVDALYPNVGVSMVKIFERLGYSPEFDPSNVCCGQPPFNAGFWQEARAIARPVLQRLSQAETIVVPSGSCGAMIRVFYRELFKDDPLSETAREVSLKTFEFSEFLVDQLQVTSLGSRFPAKVTFHDGCHGFRELKIKQQPRTLLANVAGLKLVEMADQSTCCGFGGTFSVKFPMISTAMGDMKCAVALETGAEYIVSNDSSCLMHLQGLLSRQGRAIKTIHLAEILASR